MLRRHVLQSREKLQLEFVHQSPVVQYAPVILTSRSLPPFQRSTGISVVMADGSKLIVTLVASLDLERILWESGDDVSNAFRIAVVRFARHP